MASLSLVLLVAVSGPSVLGGWKAKSALTDAVITEKGGEIGEGKRVGRSVCLRAATWGDGSVFGDKGHRTVLLIMSMRNMSAMRGTS